jgi:hypothetical protein
MDWPIEVVEWVDSESVDAWTSLEELNVSQPVIITLGYLVKETKDAIAISPNWDNKNKNVSCVMIIPKCCIKKRRKMKWDGQGKRKTTK